VTGKWQGKGERGKRKEERGKRKEESKNHLEKLTITFPFSL
jgi:hypothetical protein